MLMLKRLQLMPAALKANTAAADARRLALMLKLLVAEELPRIAATKWTLRLLLLSVADDKTAPQEQNACR